MSEPAVEAVSTAPDIDAEADFAIMVCDGDVRAALKATLGANAFLEEEVERIREMLSAGYGRGKVRKVPLSKREAQKRYGLPLP